MKGQVRDALIASQVMVAVSRENPDDIVASIVYKNNNLIYGYVRHGFRKEGHFKELCRRAGPFRTYSYCSGGWDHQRGGLEYRPWFVGA